MSILNKLFGKGKPAHSPVQQRKYENPTYFIKTSQNKPKHLNKIAVAVDDYYSSAVESLSLASNSIEVLKIVRAFRFDIQRVSILLENDVWDRRNGSQYRKHTIEQFERDPKIVKAFEDADKNFEKWDDASQKMLGSIVAEYRDMPAHVRQLLKDEKISASVKQILLRDKRDSSPEVLLESIKDSANIINTTIDPYKFFFRFKDIIKELEELIGRNLSPYEFSKGDPQLDLDRLLQNKDATIKDFIKRCYKNAFARLENIKLLSNKEKASDAVTDFRMISVYGRDLLSEKNMNFYNDKLRSLENMINPPVRSDASSSQPLDKHYDDMDGHEFEDFCADLLRNVGFSKVEATSGSGDYGVDIFAEKDGITYAIQCKRLSSKVGNKAVQEVFSGKNFYKRHLGVVLTNQYFTPAAKKTAEHTGIVLWDRDYLDKLIGTNNEDIPFGSFLSNVSSENTKGNGLFDVDMINNKPFAPYRYPPSSLLTEPQPSKENQSSKTEEALEINAERLVAVLKSFGISATAVGVTQGLSVTRYEFEPEVGTKLAAITSLADDISLSLGVANVRIAMIPDRANIVGIGVPSQISTLYIRDLIESPEFCSASDPATIIVGRGIDGQNLVANLSSLPHLLIAGSDGSGKTVFLDSIISSMLYKASPEQLRFIMIDAKMVDLKIFNGSPHLLMPVVTDEKKAVKALEWIAGEIDRRHSLLGQFDIDSFNEKTAKEANGEIIPRIIVIIDHIAMLFGIHKELEEIIARIAKKASMCGVHLILSTQQPEAKVINGIIKATNPSRIAFHISSKNGSQAILGSDEAQKLMQCGDMLYLPAGAERPFRVQGCYITEKEIARVVEYISSTTSIT